SGRRSTRSFFMFACTDSATLFNMFAVLCTQQRWCRVPGKTSSSAFQKPSAPSPTAISGVIFNPRLFTSMSSSCQLCALSRTPTWKPMSSFLPSGVAPISTSMHSLWSSMRACRNTPSAHTYRYRRADKSRFCQCPYSPCHSAVKTGNHRRRQIRRVLAQQRRQGLPEVSGRDASQIKHRQKRIQALRSTCPQRQNRRGEPDPLAVADGPAIPNLHPGDLDSADPRLDHTFGTMTVANNTISPISKPEGLHRGKKHLGLQLDSLREQLSRARSQDIGQGIIDLVGVTKTYNI